MRRLFAFGLALLLVAASLSFVPSQPALAQDGAILGDAPYLANGAVVAASGTDIVSAASVPSVDISSRANSANFYFSYFTGQPDSNWTGSQASCNPGATSAAFKAAVIDRIAFYRAMAGVPSSVGLAADSSAADQQAALMFSRNGQLSHSPSSSWACYTSTGAQAAASSNIALGAYGVGAIDAYMKDAGGGNAATGHRRWILYPQTQSFGTGDVPQVGSYSSANALWVWDANVDGPRPTTRDGFVAWPAPGYMPYQIVFPRWTFSYPNANFGSASVSVMLDGASLPVSIDSSTATGYGENTIVFRPNNLGDGAAWGNPGTDKTYTVKISGVSVGGQNRTFTYNVTVFDPSSSDPGPTTPTRTPTRTATGAPGTGTGTATPTVIPGGYAPGDLFITTNSVSLRTGPGTAFSRIAVLPTGTIGQVTGPPIFADGYTFYPVTVNGIGSGYAAGEYFNHISPTVTPTPTATTAASTATATTAASTATATPTATTAASTATATPTTAAPTRIPGGFLPGDTVRTTATVNLRSGPGTGYSVVSVVGSNTQGTITGSPVVSGSLTWYPITIPGVGSGWIASQYMALVSVGNPPPTAVSTATSAPPATATVSGGLNVGTTVYMTANVNIRTGPGTGYSVKGVAAKGTSAVITGPPTKVGSVSWFPLDVSGLGAGWASGSYLSTTPTVQGPQLPTSQDPTDDSSDDDTSTPTGTSTAKPSSTSVPTSTPTVVDIITATSSPATTPTVKEPQVSGPQRTAGATTAPDDVIAAAAPTEPADLLPTEAPAELPSAEAPTTEAAPLGLPIERVQRSPDSQPGQLLVDGDPSTVWFANGAGQPLAMFVLDLGQETSFSQIGWQIGNDGLSGTLYLSVSSDGENWTDIDPTTAALDADGWTTLNVSSSGRYIRFVFVNDTGAEWLGGISDVRIMP